MVNILYYCRLISTPGGLARIVIEKANYLSRKHNVFILTTDHKDKDTYYQLNEKVIHIDYADYSGTNNVWLSKHKFKQIIGNINPDIIITASGKEALLLPFFENKIPNIFEMHFSCNFREMHNFQSKLYKRAILKVVDRIEPWVFLKYNRVVLLTNEDKKRCKFDNTTVIYNSKTIEVKEQARLDKEVVIAVGRLSKEKGFDLLLESWRIVCQKNKSWVLKIFGDGELISQLRHRCEILGIERRVIFKGNVKDITSRYMNSSIFVMTSQHEGLPLTLIESMECGLPIVSFDCLSGPREIVNKHKSGYLVKQGDTKEFARRLLELMESKSKRKRYGKNAREGAAVFDKEPIMKKWEGLIETIIKESSTVA